MPRNLNPRYVGRIIQPSTLTPGVGRESANRSHVSASVVADFRARLETVQPRLPGTITELRDELAAKLGGRAKVAEALAEGRVNPRTGEPVKVRSLERTIQRYISAEEHRGSQARGVNVADREALRDRMRALLAPLARSEALKQMRENGIRIQGDFEVRFSDENEWRHLRGLIPPAQAAAIVKLMEANKYDQAARLTAQSFIRGWMNAKPSTRLAELPSLENTTDLSLRPED
jgi:hypothetical protein